MNPAETYNDFKERYRENKNQGETNLPDSFY